MNYCRDRKQHLKEHIKYPESCPNFSPKPITNIRKISKGNLEKKHWDTKHKEPNIICSKCKYDLFYRPMGGEYDFVCGRCWFRVGKKSVPDQQKLIEKEKMNCKVSIRVHNNRDCLRFKRKRSEVKNDNIIQN